MATATTYDNGANSAYPLTKMNFLVVVDGISGTAAFSEVTGIDASVDVVEFRQGNSGSLAPVKIPGLVKHGNITLKMGYILDSPSRHGSRSAYPRSEVRCRGIRLR